MKLEEKKAIVTGANKGIGLAIVETFAKHGCDVYACARAKNIAWEEYLETISKKNEVSIVPVYFDLADESGMKRELKNILGNDNIDILVNNAGVSKDSLFLMTSMKDMREMFEINYFSQLAIIQLVTKKMMRQKTGSIINICSVSGIENETGRLAYGSSKSALAFATKTLSLELGQYGIRVNAVSPGFIDTDMWRNRTQDLYEKVLNETPLMKQGTVEDVSNAVLFLASDDSKYITGHNLVVDGGRMK